MTYMKSLDTTNDFTNKACFQRQEENARIYKLLLETNMEEKQAHKHANTGRKGDRGVSGHHFYHVYATLAHQQEQEPCDIL